jgi:hypothetical protein
MHVLGFLFNTHPHPIITIMTTIITGKFTTARRADVGLIVLIGEV